MKANASQAITVQKTKKLATTWRHLHASLSARPAHEHGRQQISHTFHTLVLAFTKQHISAVLSPLLAVCFLSWAQCAHAPSFHKPPANNKQSDASRGTPTSDTRLTHSQNHHYLVAHNTCGIHDGVVYAGVSQQPLTKVGEHSQTSQLRLLPLVLVDHQRTPAVVHHVALDRPGPAGRQTGASTVLVTEPAEWHGGSSCFGTQCLLQLRPLRMLRNPDFRSCVHAGYRIGDIL